MAMMFQRASQFNQTLGRDVSMTNTYGMFYASQFNQLWGHVCPEDSHGDEFRSAAGSTSLGGVGRVQSDEHGVHVSIREPVQPDFGDMTCPE